jgi:AhpD family alkylhydroperoxidase
VEKNFIDITSNISSNLKVLRRDSPDTMAGFSALAQAATRSGALDKKTKELIALALGVAGHCEGCIGFHAETLVRLGASREEVEETLGGGVYGRWAILDVCRRRNGSLRAIHGKKECGGLSHRSFRARLMSPKQNSVSVLAARTCHGQTCLIDEAL